MAASLVKFWERGFKFYFAFCLMAFTLLILLMNLPRMGLLANRAGGIQPAPAENPETAPVVSSSPPNEAVAEAL